MSKKIQPCPSADVLTDYCLGRLSFDELDAIEEHVNECPPCQAAIETLDQKSDTLIQELRTPAEPDEFREEQELARAIHRAKSLPESGTRAAEHEKQKPEFDPYYQCSPFRRTNALSTTIACWASNGSKTIPK